jgi:hypothetical protein
MTILFLLLVSFLPCSSVLVDEYFSDFSDLVQQLNDGASSAGFHFVTAQHSERTGDACFRCSHSGAPRRRPAAQKQRATSKSDCPCFVRAYKVVKSKKKDGHTGWHVTTSNLSHNHSHDLSLENEQLRAEQDAVLTEQVWYVFFFSAMCHACLDAPVV